ncbi:MAG: HAD-IIIA family hydrolase [Lachnospiraceae bacterium]|nr:HAD-IIIA family hydrolase [Lachnospiraceae bacterium]
MMRNLEDIQVVVLMGGLGTRLKEYTKQCPKSLVQIGSRPFFDYELDLLQQWGFRRFLFLIGYQADMIRDHYGDGSDRGLSIQYCMDGEKLLGTGGAVRRALPYLDEDFLLIYGDSFMDIDYEESVYRYFKGKETGQQALMTVLENKDRFDKSNVIVKDGKIVLYDKHHTVPEMDHIDYGVCMYERSLFEDYEEDLAFDIAEIQTRLSREGKLAAHIVSKRFYEIGSPESMKEFEAYARHRFEEAHPAVFLDRDGVINEIVYNEDTELFDSAANVSQFRMFPYVAAAIDKIREKGYYVFVVTNQPSAAKGKTTLCNLYDINTFFRSMVEIDDLFMCPHYPEMLPMSREPYLIRTCNCRKPKSGLLEKAARKYNLDLAASYMVGDSYTDVLAGKAMGVKTILLGGMRCDVCNRLEGNKPDHILKDLSEVTKVI